MPERCIGIYWNSSKPSGTAVALDLIRMLNRKGVSICVNQSLASELAISDVFVDAFERCQLLFVLGGDGWVPLCGSMPTELD